MVYPHMIMLKGKGKYVEPPSCAKILTLLEWPFDGLADFPKTFCGRKSPEQLVKQFLHLLQRGFRGVSLVWLDHLICQPLQGSPVSEPNPCQLQLRS
jgi:hypothetical protein